MGAEFQEFHCRLLYLVAVGGHHCPAEGLRRGYHDPLRKGRKTHLILPAIRNLVNQPVTVGEHGCLARKKVAVRHIVIHMQSILRGVGEKLLQGCRQLVTAWVVIAFRQHPAHKIRSLRILRHCRRGNQHGGPAGTLRMQGQRRNPLLLQLITAGIKFLPCGRKAVYPRLCEQFFVIKHTGTGKSCRADGT